ncbi:DNA topoisomerase IV subunit B [Bacteroidales bacterium]
MNTYTENEIKLEWNEHIRRRPGMYIGKFGDGSSPDDGIYVLHHKEVMHNSVDEYAMGYGKQIVISISDKIVTVRDYGRGIPLDSLIVAASKMNTGAKYDNKAFKKSVGLNGVGIKAVNALSIDFKIQSYRDGESQMARFSKGILTEQERVLTSEKNGTLVTFLADEELFGNYIFNYEFIETMLRNYSYLNSGLLIKFDGKEFISKNGLLDLLNETLVKEPLYPPVYLKGDDIEIAITHGNDYGEGISSFVNGQFTTQGGTHLSAFREAVSKTIKDFYKRDFDPADVRQGMIAAVSIKVQDPVFESQTKTKLGSKEMGPGGVTVRNFIGDFLKEKLDNYLHRHPDTADAILKKILDSEKERKAISGIQKLARERAKKANLHNRKLRDCRIHYTDKHERSLESTLFITEGDSASGSITKSRDVMTQAVFSLRGKPQNSYGLSKKIVYENEEFNLLQAALNIEDDIENLRYNKIVMATDADVDGMHIRMLLLAFFLQFFPDLVRQGHLYILQTPLFRVRNKKETTYCYSDEEREKAIKKLGPNPEITRFKGLGEISPDEFRNFIGETIRLDRVRLGNDDNIPELLEFYMGKNTPDRQNFVRANLRNEVV